MKIKRQKSFAKTEVVKEVRQSTEWIKKRPSDPGLLQKKTTKRVSLFSEELQEE
jgi:hypothetical protein